ncbi:MAG: hypothetical protein AB2777_09990 [Candidatus Thiodiazotropha endolucinida]
MSSKINGGRKVGGDCPVDPLRRGGDSRQPFGLADRSTPIPTQLMLSRIYIAAGGTII